MGDYWLYKDGQRTQYRGSARNWCQGLQSSDSGKSLGFTFRKPDGEAVYVWVNGREFGPYAAASRVGFLPGTEHYAFWAVPPDAPKPPQDNPGPGAYDKKYCRLVLDGKQLGDYYRSDKRDTLIDNPDSDPDPPPKGYSAYYNTTPYYVMRDRLLFVVENGKPVGPFSYVEASRDEGPQGPVTIFAVPASPAEFWPGDVGRQALAAAQGCAVVNGEAYPIEEYLALRTVGGHVTHRSQQSYPGTGVLWVAGRRYGPFYELFDYAISPDQQQLTIIFRSENSGYIWQGPVPQ